MRRQFLLLTLSIVLGASLGIPMWGLSGSGSDQYSQAVVANSAPTYIGAPENLQVLNSEIENENVSPSLLVVQNGQSEYEIVIASNAIEGVREAANELQRLVKKSTGAYLPITHSPRETYKQVIIGANALAKEAGITDKNLKLDGYYMRVQGNNIYLVGKDDSKQEFYALNNSQSASAGSYYAVIDFARRFLKAQWFLPGPLGEEVPKAVTLRVPALLDVEGGPRFGMRSIDVTKKKTREYQERLFSQGVLNERYFDQNAVDETSKWGRHLRLGSNFQLSVGHAWYQWMPAEQSTIFSPRVYGESNPEFFATPGGNRGEYYYGKNGTLGGQLCICNPDVAETFAENIIAYAKKTGKRNFSLSPNDGNWGCSCSCCKRNMARYKEGTPELTAEVIKFSNRIVELVVREVPDARFGLYAYHWTLEPPIDVQARQEIDISDVYNGLPYRYHKPGERESVENNIRSWRARGENVVLTTYYTFYGHYSLPWSTIDTQGWLFRLLKENGSSAGVRMNFAVHDLPPMGILGPDPWVLSELLWDPEQSIKELTERFYPGAFGKDAGPLINEYFDIIGVAMENAIHDQDYKEASGVKGYILPAYSPIRKHCRDLMDRATLAVTNEEERYRWRVSLIARAWKLAEITVDALQAEQNGNKAFGRKLLGQRKVLLVDKESVFSLAPVSTNFQEKLSPLIK